MYIDNLKSLKDNCIPKKWICFSLPSFKLWVNTTKLRVDKKNRSELGTLEWDILNPYRLSNLEINNMRRTSII